MAAARVTANSRMGYTSDRKIVVTRRFTNKSLGHVRVRVTVYRLRDGAVLINRKTDYPDMHRGDSAYTRECRYYNLV